MFLSREIDMKLCQNYTKIYGKKTMEFCITSVGLNRSYSANRDIFAEYDLLKPTTFIQNCIYIFMNFRLILTQC